VEVVPYSATKAMEVGSYRNLDYTLGTNGVYTASNVLTTTNANG